MDAAPAKVLRLAIAFVHFGREADAQEVEHFGRNGRAAAYYESDASAETLADLIGLEEGMDKGRADESGIKINKKKQRDPNPHLAEHGSIPQEMRDMPVLKPFLFLIIRSVEQQRSDAALSFNTGKHFIIDPVEESGHGDEDGGLELCNIVEEFESVALVVADGGTAVDEKRLGGALEHVRQRKV
ncbi:hypothetical protein BC936DRAFT_141466 [Jimgerdemannia flammicorona]|uniref:Uncharacterized protein n=2 Tax=Jimgerdemannia flammicorona TaxID=994334 RepID=A0A433QPR3_9FUNG|nr:hypothetical protein BC936DRAFT_141466 [Jimgerdemannia flammicorona]RUS31747.1 hypothetical protein BC938DRAFT_477192 [Jimgerdemannia flammicorona]